jgi:hypothetical protein
LSANDFFNAVLATSAQVRPSSLSERVYVLDEDARGATYKVTLHRHGKPVNISVDSQFYRRGDSSGGYLEGNALGMTCLTKAMWPALFEKAFIKLIDSFPQDFLRDPGRKDDTFSELPEQTLMMRGWDALKYARPQLAIETLSAVPVQVFRLNEQAPLNDTVLAALGSVQRGEAVGVVALLIPEQDYVRSAAFRPRVRTEEDTLGTYPAGYLHHPPDGQICRLFLSDRSNATNISGAEPATIVCSNPNASAGTSAQDVFFNIGQAWGVFGWGNESQTLTLQGPLFGPSGFSLRDTTLFKGFQHESGYGAEEVKLSVLGFLNGTLFVASLPNAAEGDRQIRGLTLPYKTSEYISSIPESERTKERLATCGFSIDFKEEGFPFGYIGMGLGLGSAALFITCFIYCSILSRR